MYNFNHNMTNIGDKKTEVKKDSVYDDKSMDQTQ
jgi:hypothetical protein